MTDVGPMICFACTRLDRSTTSPTGGLMPQRCTAYPGGIPDEIRRGGDHRQLRGDEVAGQMFDQQPGLESTFETWQRFHDLVTAD